MHPNALKMIEDLKAEGALVSDTVAFPYSTLIYYTPADAPGVHTVEVEGGWKGDQDPKKLPRKPNVVIT